MKLTDFPAERQMIWADRLAITFFLIFGFLLGAIYRLFGAPGAFQIEEEITIFCTVAIWFIGRALDFMFTGRIR